MRERVGERAFGCTTESTHWKLAVLAAGASVAARTSTGKPSVVLIRATVGERDRKGARDLRDPSSPNLLSIFFSFISFSNLPARRKVFTRTVIDNKKKKERKEGTIYRGKDI